MATCSAVPESTIYRIALVLPSSRGLLTVAQVPGAHRLPRLSIGPNARVTASLQAAIRATWGTSGFVLEYLSTTEECSPCAIVELASERIPSGLLKTSLDRVNDDEFSEYERASLRSILHGESPDPLTRIGWVRNAFSWVEETTGEQIHSADTITQLNAGGGFALLRLPMRSGTIYWFKATGKPNLHEPRLSLLLTSLCAEWVPRVLDSRADWNAWIMAEEPLACSELSTAFERRQEVLERAAGAMARLQCNTIGHEEDFLSAGAFDQRIDTLRMHSKPLFDRIREAMSLQTSIKVPRIESGRLQELMNIFAIICDLVSKLPIPTTIIHGDLNEGNVLWGEGGCKFIDWCEAYVGHPFVSLQHLLLLNQVADNCSDPPSNQFLTDQYCAVMGEVCDPEVLNQALPFMPFLAAASALYGRGGWLTSAIPDAVHRQAWIRTLARHMDRAARDSVLLRRVRGECAFGSA